MKKQTTSVTHSDKEFVLNVGWLNYLYSEPVKAHFEIETDDIQLLRNPALSTMQSSTAHSMTTGPDHWSRLSLSEFSVTYCG